MKLVRITLAIVSLIAGLAAAWYWYQASIVETDPGEAVKSGIMSTQDRAWISALLSATSEAARLNKRASLLTALAVAFGSASSLF